MTSPAVHGSPFLVGRGRERGYDLLVAPDLVAAARAGEEIVSAVATEVPEEAPPAITEVTVPGVGPVAVVYRTRQVTAGDVDADAAAPDDPVLDSAGDPLVVAYGFVCGDARIEHVDERDLAAVWPGVLDTYRAFLADEADHTAITSTPFALASPTGHRRPHAGDDGDTAATTPATDPEEVDALAAARPNPAPAARRPAPWLLVALAAAAFAGAAWLLGSARTVPPTGTVEGTVCRIDPAAPNTCAPGVAEIELVRLDAGGAAGPTRVAVGDAPAAGVPSPFRHVVEVGVYRVAKPASCGGQPAELFVAEARTIQLYLTCAG